MDLKFVCENCGSDKVQAKAWVSLNKAPRTIDFSPSENGDYEDHWCDKCQSHTTVITEDEYLENREEDID